MDSISAAGPAGIMLKFKKNQHALIIASVIAILVIWAGDAFYDSFVEQQGPFFVNLTETSLHQLIFKSILTALFICFGLIAIQKLNKHRLADAVLQQHSIAMESSMDGIAIYDRDGAYVYANQAYATINGYGGPGELLGKSYKSAYDDIELEKMEHVLIPALQKNI